jgi:phosphoglycolate phosphatase-like HAD superfamily hydrolase
MKCTLFFDLDGTLLDVKKKNYTVHKELAQKYNFTAINERLYWLKKRQHLPLWDVLPHFFTEYSTDFIERIEQPDVLRFDTIIPGGHSLLIRLGEIFSIVLVTKRKERENVLKQLEELSILNLFTDILTPDGKKEDAIKTFSYSPKDIVIGDTEEDVIAAKSLTIPSIAVSWGLRTGEYLQSFFPSLLVHTVADLYSQLTL